MRTRKCCIRDCKNRREDAPLHYFPMRDKQRLNRWLDSINSDVLRRLPLKKLAERTVCNIHFEKRFIRPNSRLRYGAYPSLFTIEEISGGVPRLPLADIQNKYERPGTSKQATLKKHLDHNYYCKDKGQSQEVACSTMGLYNTNLSLFTSEVSIGMPQLPDADKGNEYERPTLKRHWDHDYCDPAGPSPKVARSAMSSDDINSSLFTSEVSSGVLQLPDADNGNKYERPTLKRQWDHNYCDPAAPSSMVARFAMSSDDINSSLFTSEVSSRRPQLLDADNGNKYEQPTLKRQWDHDYCDPAAPSSKVARTATSSDDISSSLLPTEVISGVPQLTCTGNENEYERYTIDNEGPSPNDVRSRTSYYNTNLSPCEEICSGVPRLPNTDIHNKHVKHDKGPVSKVARTTTAPTLKLIEKSRPSRKRLIQKINNLTPTCKKIYRELSKAKQQADFHKRAKRALMFSKQNSFEELTRNMNPYAKKIMQMQIKLCKKNKKARRFTDLEKVIGLAIMKQSPKCYRFLQQIFILPSKSTLNKVISQLDIDVGINKGLVEVMKKEVESWDNIKKMCSIVFDEMHLDEGLNFDQKKDCINGLVHLNEKSKEIADQALVFMLRGAVYKWQQPFAFYFCKGTIKSAELKHILKDIVAATIEIGLNPLCTVCDQGSTFRKALEELQQETRREQILTNLPPDETVALCGIKMQVIYDPPHLIKGVRNNFLDKQIEIDGKVSKWQDIVDVYLTDCNHAETRLLHSLNDQHVLPEKLKNKKMKVKAAVRVLSSTVSAALSYTAKFSHYADGRPVSDTMANTAETVKFFDKLFDSMNGASLHHKHTKGKSLRQAVTATSDHHTFWKEAVQKLEKYKFRDTKGRIVSVPTIKSCITTLKSYMKLWQVLKDQGVKVMRPRYFNSDPIENFFGQVRAYNFRHNDPNCQSFVYTFRSLLITRMIKFHSVTFNCEDDQTKQLLNITQIFKLLNQNENPAPASSDIPAGSEPDLPHSSGCVENIVNQARRERLEVHSRAYTAGWVVRKVLAKTPCDECKQKLTVENNLPIHDWVSHREYNQAKKRLNYPSEKAVLCFGTVLIETNNFLEHNPNRLKVSKHIKNHIIKHNDFSNYSVIYTE